MNSESQSLGYGSLSGFFSQYPLNESLTTGLDTVSGNDYIPYTDLQLNTESEVYQPYDGDYTFFNDHEQRYDYVTYFMFFAFAVAISGLLVIQLFRVAINTFKKIT